MTAVDLEKLKYPIGNFEMPHEVSPEMIARYIAIIENFPQKIDSETAHLTDEQLDTPYRPNGWTIRQVVHHCADSHINALIRVKLGLTEDNPTIKPYLEAKWAELPDGKSMPVAISLNLLKSVHHRWIIVLKSMANADFKRTFIHPENNQLFRLEQNTALYAWHCEHHLAHITTLKKSKNWK